jgi:3-dehydroquinate synthase
VSFRQSITVAFDYDVHFTERAFALDEEIFVSCLARREPARRQRFVALIDDGVAAAWPDLGRDIAGYARHHAARLELVAEPQVVAGGEHAKNEGDHVERLWQLLDHHAMDRQSFVVAIGGGAMLDWVGYAAATAHRGVRLVRVPTTVLAQADSGVGVKNGVNHFDKKNFVGTFAPPWAVINDSAFLGTLSPRDTIAGMAEAVKVALIRDHAFFAWLSGAARELAACQPTPVAELVRRCAELHLMHIRQSGDPFEMGSARPLDFGHWCAHKLETLSGYELRHGEAVAVGMALDTIYSSLAGLCREQVVDAVVDLLAGLGFSLWHPALERCDASGQPLVLAGLMEFHEHLGGELTITLLEDVGRGVEVHHIDHDVMSAALARLRARATTRGATA